MNPVLSAIAAKAAAAATGAAIAKLGSRVKATRRPDFDPQAVVEALDQSVLQASFGELEFPNEGAERLITYLGSPEFGTIAFHLTLVRSVGGPITDVDAVRDEFRASVHLFTRLESSQEDAVFGVLLQAVDTAIGRAVGTVTSDTRSDAVDLVVRAHLGAIARNIAGLAAAATSGESAADLEAMYRGQAQHRHSTIMPPNFGGAKRVPIDEIYVSPKIRDSADEREELAYSEFVRRIDRTVLLGDPGGGKSTLSQKIVHDLANETLFSEESLQSTPFLVVLREFGAEKKERPQSILQHLRMQLRARYQVDMPSEMLEHLLLNGRALVIFDGLDELLDSSYRREISEDVESFCNLYPSTPVLVTSRLVGYEEAPLDTRVFDSFVLAELSEEKVADYASKWFALDDQLSPEEANELATAFLRESEVVSDLRSNPLMLSLMCNIYKGESYIPSNRPDVYEKCALMLFERWDAQRNIRVGLPFESHIRPAMMHLAHAIYGAAELQPGVSRSALEKLASAYLLERRFDDVDEAADAAHKFVEFCTNRAWVFTDVGTTPEGEPLFQFTHRTFLEYFTAGHLVRQNPSPAELLEVLRPHIVVAEWDVVAQLAVQMQNRNVVAAADSIMEALIVDLPGGRGRNNILSFCARSLGFLVPSARVVKAVASAVVNARIDDIEQGVFERVDDEFTQGMDDPLRSLCEVSDENYRAVRSALHDVLAQYLADGRKAAGAVVWSLRVIHELVRTKTGAKRESDILALSEELSATYAEELRTFAMTNAPQAVAALRAAHVSFNDVIEWHGLKIIVEAHPCYLHGIWYTSLAGQICRVVAFPHDDQGESILKIASEVADVVLAEPLPLRATCTAQFDDLPSVYLREATNGGTPDVIEPKSLEGAVVSLALLWTADEARRGDAHPEPLPVDALGPLAPASDLFELRAGRLSESLAVMQALSDLGFRHELINLLIRWANREIELAVIEVRRVAG